MTACTNPNCRRHPSPPGGVRCDDVADPVLARMKSTGLCWFCAAGVDVLGSLKKEAPQKKRKGRP